MKTVTGHGQAPLLLFTVNVGILCDTKLKAFYLVFIFWGVLVGGRGEVAELDLNICQVAKLQLKSVIQKTEAMGKSFRSAAPAVFS